MAVKSKLLTGAIFGTPAAGGTLTGLIALKLGVPLDTVLLGVSLLTQILQALASRVQKRRKATAAVRA